MFTINWFSKPTHSDSNIESTLTSLWVRLPNALSARFGRDRGSKYGSWCTLNEHLLDDIGETRTSAKTELLRNPWSAPLGTLSGHAQVKGQPIFPCRTSPLG
jgi:hypothetical protein